MWHGQMTPTRRVCVDFLMFHSHVPIVGRIWRTLRLLLLPRRRLWTPWWVWWAGGGGFWISDLAWILDLRHCIGSEFDGQIHCVGYNIEV